MDTTDAPQIIEHIHKPVNFTPYETRWVPFSSRFLATGIYPNGKGALNVYQLSSGDLEVISETVTPHGLRCATFGASSLSQRQIATGDHVGRLVVYDLSRLSSSQDGSSAEVFSQQAHSSIINCIDGCGGLGIGGGAPELVTGGRDGCVRLWDIRMKEPVLALEPDAGSGTRDCWAVAFGNSFSDQGKDFLSLLISSY